MAKKERHVRPSSSYSPQNGEKIEKEKRNIGAREKGRERLRETEKETDSRTERKRERDYSEQSTCIAYSQCCPQYGPLSPARSNR